MGMRMCPKPPMATRLPSGTYLWMASATVVRLSASRRDLLSRTHLRFSSGSCQPMSSPLNSTGSLILLSPLSILSRRSGAGRLLYQVEVNICRFKLGVAKESPSHLFTDPVDVGILGVNTDQPSQEQGVALFKFHLDQDEGTFRQESLRSEIADGKGVDPALRLDLNPFGLLAGVHVMTTRGGVSVSR